jgi:hypothetical protein
VYLAYADDSGTGDKKDPYQLLTAIIIEDKNFTTMEVLCGAAIEALVPEHRLPEFEEFHAADLYYGCGVFEGVAQKERFAVIQLLLTAVKTYGIGIVYGAVNKTKLAKRLYGSAHPLDVCFRICIEGIEQWAGSWITHEMAILIVDDCTDKKLKDTLRDSFRELRKRVRSINSAEKTAWHLHDDMYFGSSKDSVGIQLADLCSYFIKKHIRGGDEIAETFYKMIEECIYSGQIEPQEKSPTDIGV